MLYTAKIKEVNKEFSLPDNCSLLSVCFDILLDGDVVAERRLGFPIDTSEEQITDEVKKYCVMYAQDHELAADAAERSEAEAGASEVIKNLVGKELSPDKETVPAKKGRGSSKKSDDED